MRLLIANGTLVTPEGTRRADVLCEQGRIAGLLDAGVRARADELLDATGLLVFPGFIDPHVHSRDPGLTEKEDFAHVTRSALASGLTTILDMPNAVPPLTDVATFEQRAREHAAVAEVDFGLWAQTLGAENLDQLPSLAAAGAVAFKLFWGYGLDRRTKRLVYTFADVPPDEVLPPTPLGEIHEVMRELAAAGALMAAHCEDREIMAAGARPPRRPIQRYADLLAVRPPLAETVSVGLAAQLAADTSCRFHVVHVSAAQTVALLRQAQARGAPISGETCPQYLLLTDADYAELGPRMKVYPPIRTAADQAALWAGLADGTLASIGSDHAPHTAEEQERPLATRPAGILGIETLTPLMLDAMYRGCLSPERVAALLAGSTAVLYGIDHRKGLIRTGNDADFTLVDPARPFAVDVWRLHSLNPSSVWHGHRGHGVAVASVLRGAVLMRDGEPVGSPRGAFVRSRAAQGEARLNPRDRVAWPCTGLTNEHASPRVTYVGGPCEA
jgi:allantoinase